MMQFSSLVWQPPLETGILLPWFVDLARRESARGIPDFPPRACKRFALKLVNLLEVISRSLDQIEVSNFKE